MKLQLNLKLDKATFQNFFVNHGEKIAFVLILVIVALIGFLGPGLGDPLNLAPAWFLTRADNMRAQISAAVPKPAAQGVDLSGLAKSHTVDGEKYALNAPFDPAVFQSKSRRGKPQTYPLEQLRGQGEIAAFMMLSTPAKSGPTGRDRSPSARSAERVRETNMARGVFRSRGLAGGSTGTAGTRREARAWVSLVGLVPFEKQRTAYREAFRNAVGYDAQLDSVGYRGYRVERLEISSPADSVSPDWTKAKKIDSLRSHPAEEAERRWPPQAQTQGEVVDPKYTDRVIPLVFPLGPLVGRSWGANVAHEPEIPLRLGATPVSSGGLPVGGLSWGGGRRGAAAGAPGGSSATLMGQPVKPPDYRLFRFLDFDVELGKHYMYRVCLVLANPNYKRKTSSLIDPQTAENAFLDTDWSKPSPVVSVPGTSGVLLLSVTPPTGRSSEPLASVLLTKWQMDQGTELHQKTSFSPGQIANFNPQAPKNATTLPEFATNSLVVDLRGDERPTKKDHETPDLAELLLLTAGGDLVVRNEIDDASASEELTAPPGTTPAGPGTDREGPQHRGGMGDALMRAMGNGGGAGPSGR